MLETLGQPGNGAATKNISPPQEAVTSSIVRPTYELIRLSIETQLAVRTIRSIAQHRTIIVILAIPNPHFLECLQYGMVYPALGYLDEA